MRRIIRPPAHPRAPTLMLRLVALVAMTAALAGAFTAPAARPGRAPERPLAGALQAVVVTTAGWDSVPGTLRRYERASATAPWRPVGDAIPVVVGKGGLGWGIGVHGEGGPPGRTGRVKREGDGRSPAGVFRLGPAFGWAPAAEVPWIRLPYVHLTDDWKCPDDAASAHYNRLVDQRTVRPDWKSHENMRIAAYRLGAVVQHNWGDRTRPGAGSCIFLHIWDGPGSSTVGCTAMAEGDVAALLRWLDPRRRPVLVQLPREEYAALRGGWALP